MFQCINTNCVSCSVCSGSNTVKAARTILDDIGNMFDDLADQLDAMLDWSLFITSVLLQPQEAKQRTRDRFPSGVLKLCSEHDGRCQRRRSGTRLVSRPEHQHLPSSVLPHHGPELTFLTDGGFWLPDGSGHFFNLCNARVVVVSHQTWTKHRDRSWTSGLFSAHWEEKLLGWLLWLLLNTNINMKFYVSDWEPESWCHFLSSVCLLLRNIDWVSDILVIISSFAGRHGSFWCLSCCFRFSPSYRSIYQIPEHTHTFILLENGICKSRNFNKPAEIHC